MACKNPIKIYKYKGTQRRYWILVPTAELRTKWAARSEDPIRVVVGTDLTAAALPYSGRIVGKLLHNWPDNYVQITVEQAREEGAIV